MDNKVYTTIAEEIPDSDELSITLDPELIEQMGWTKDTTLIWQIDDDGKVYIKAK
jgi:hypothetical protein